MLHRSTSAILAALAVGCWLAAPPVAKGDDDAVEGFFGTPRPMAPKVGEASGGGEQGGPVVLTDRDLEQIILLDLDSRPQPKRANETGPGPAAASAARIIQTLARLDFDRSGTLSWNEFSRLGDIFPGARGRGGSTRRLEEAFRMLDANGDGQITSEELARNWAEASERFGLMRGDRPGPPGFGFPPRQ